MSELKLPVHEYDGLVWDADDRLVSVDTVVALLNTRAPESKWISVKERLPEEGREIWACDGKNVWATRMGACIPWANGPHRPTYWMPRQPLPTPPAAAGKVK